ncbi:hypothetical protein ILUMI_17452 [Ignelater luminosus]|uniref:Uncharacterized protein n=1 Tax=Ignelater luminosus TaxID=2038154 RepID=A0A8K0G7I6_IGNLU|nr:hypothetical protein ILUMI_17452 [Ignelater luminosus]
MEKIYKNLAQVDSDADLSQMSSYMTPQGFKFDYVSRDSPPITDQYGDYKSDCKYIIQINLRFQIQQFF